MMWRKRHEQDEAEKASLLEACRGEDPMAAAFASGARIRTGLNA
jgi:hypothetical protein